MKIKNDRKVLVELRSVIHPVRHIQKVAQKTRELAVFQVYLLLINLYFGVLNTRTPLDLYDPSLTKDSVGTVQQNKNPLDATTPTGRAHWRADVLQLFEARPLPALWPGGAGQPAQGAPAHRHPRAAPAA